MKNRIFKYLALLVLLMSTGNVTSQDLIIDHKIPDKLGEEIAGALLASGKSDADIKSIKIISTENVNLTSNDFRSQEGGLRKHLTHLQDIDLSETKVNIFDASIFQSYKTLVSISLPSNTTSISSYMFKGCVALTTIKSWGTVKKINKEAFDGCTVFNTSAFPETLEEIGDNAFKLCTSLTTSTLPDNVKIIGYQAFRQSNVTFSKWPAAIQEIGNRAFCITPVTFDTWPENIATITAGALINCNKITKFTIPATVIAVGGSAFRLSEPTVRSIYLSSASPLATIADTDVSGNGNKNPFGTDANTMANQENVTLYVPATGRDAYKSAEFWKKIKIKTRALSSTTLSGLWTKAELEAMDISDANLTDIDMSGITVPTDVVLSGSSNPNLLVYVKTSDNLTIDKGFVVKDGQIDNITLTDLKPFNPSKPISVGSISYNRPAAAAFETICLPFDAVVPIGYEVMKLNGGTLGQISLAKVSAMAANTPYMILKSTAASYAFSATEQVISNEMKAVNTEAPYEFKGTYLPMSVTAEKEENAIYISDGTEFRLTGRGASILPFRAFLEGDIRGESTPAQFVKFSNPVNIDKLGQAQNDIYPYSLNGILYIHSSKIRVLRIYGIDGRLLRSELLNEGKNQVVGLSKGIYVMDNRKVIIK